MPAEAQLEYCYCCYAETSSSAAQKRHSKVYGKPIAPALYSILLAANTQKSGYTRIVQYLNSLQTKYCTLFLAHFAKYIFEKDLIKYILL